MSISLVLADDHPLVLKGLRQLFSSEPDMTVLACCQDGETVLQSIYQHQPDILVLDLRMPQMDGLTVLRELKQKQLTVKVVILTAALDEDEVFEAIQLGVRGVVLKEMAPDLLIRCVRKVSAGGEWLEKNSVGKALEKILKRESELQRLGHVLTQREIEIIKMVANGLSNKQISERCFIGEGTVKVHLHNIYGKLGIKNRVEMTLYAREKGLL